MGAHPEPQRPTGLPSFSPSVLFPCSSETAALARFFFAPEYPPFTSPESNDFLLHCRYIIYFNNSKRQVYYFLSQVYIPPLA